MTNAVYARPDNLQDALALLRQKQFKVIAGGTDFYPSLGDNMPVAPVLDITAVKELRKIKVNTDGVEIGALSTWSDIANTALPLSLRALQLAAIEVGSVQIQNRATLVGNLCNASPAADGVPPLLCCDAMVKLASTNGVRTMPLSDYLLGNRRTDRGEYELLVSVNIPASGCRGQSDFLKLGARKYLVISIAMVACRLVIEDQQITDAAIAVGSCSEVATRLPQVEQALIGKTANPKAIVSALPSHLSGLSPIDDVRGTSDYRSVSAVTLVSRSLQRCLQAKLEAKLEAKL